MSQLMPVLSFSPCKECDAMLDCAATSFDVCLLSAGSLTSSRPMQQDWPGKKAWPGLTLLLAFFATWAFTQGLASSFA